MQGKECFPNLFTYQSDWLAHIDEFGLKPSYTVSYTGQSIYAPNTLEKPVKSAILKGNTEVVLGKNLFNGKLEDGGYSYITGKKEEKPNALRSVDFIKVEPSSTICCSNNGIERATHILEYDENKKYLKYNEAITKATLLPSTKYITFYGGNGDRDKMQIEYGEEPTYYEEYKQTLTSVKMPVLTTSNEDGTKTNILTVNEDVTLRSNGNVYDELDLLTGKLTQRIDEDGSVLTQEVVKTVDLTILDQNGQNVKQLMAFNGGTHFNTGSSVGSPLPTVSVSVETDLEETLKVCSLEGNTL